MTLQEAVKAKPLDYVTDVEMVRMLQAYQFGGEEGLQKEMDKQGIFASQHESILEVCKKAQNPGIVYIFADGVVAWMRKEKYWK